MDRHDLEAIDEISSQFSKSDVRYLRVKTEGFEIVLSRDASLFDAGVSASSGRGTAAPMPAETSPPEPATPDSSVVARSGSTDPGRDPLGSEQAGVVATRSAPGLEVTSPVVGTFYTASAPGEPPFTSVGEQVVDSDTVGLVEAMKVFTAVTSGVTGTVVELLVENESFVEQGQPLMRIEPAPGAGEG